MSTLHNASEQLFYSLYYFFRFYNITSGVDASVFRIPSVCGNGVVKKKML